MFSVTAKGRTFSFGCLEQNEVGQWTKALNQAIDDTSDSSTASDKEDPKLGGLLLGLKGALGGADDDEPPADEPLHRHTSTTAKSAPTPAAAPAADDDDPFAAIARRPSLQGKPAAVTAASLDLFATAPQAAQPTPPAPQVAAPTSAGGALSSDALMRLYAQSAVPAASAPVPMMAPALQPTGPNYKIAFGGGSPAATAFAAQPPAGALYAQPGFQAPYGQQQQQQHQLFGAPAQPQAQTNNNVDPFASLL